MHENHTLFAQVITKGIASWDTQTQELFYKGIRFSLDLDGYGVPMINQSADLFWELTTAVR